MERHEASRVPVENSDPTPAEADGRSALSPEQALAEAQSLCWTRPLKPYPKWRFGIDWENPDPSFRRRRDLWRYFNRHQIETPLDFEWYDGLKLWLYPGNDLSATLFVGGCNEPNEFAFLDRFLRPAMVFVDAGANDGLYSLFSSRRVGAAGRVFSFEPSTRELERLRANVERNGLANVTTIGVALGDQNGAAALSVADYEHEGHNTLGAFVYPAITLLRSEQVPMRTLDTVLFEAGVSRVDLIKIDVEGGETRLLAGAAQVIQKYRPVLLFEALDPALREQGSSLEELLERIRSLGYILYQFDPRTGFPAPVDHEIDESSVNLLAAPSEAPLPVGWCAPPAGPSEPGGASGSAGSSWLARFLHRTGLRKREVGLFDLNTYTVCASSQISGSGPINVVTPAGQWHYAIHFPVREDVREKLRASATIMVRLEGVVEAGRIGVGIASADGSYFLAREVERGADTRGVVFELELAGIPPGATLVVRNTFAGSRASTIRIDSITSRRL
jgi:FkbM family methyltransferase